MTRVHLIGTGGAIASRAEGTEPDEQRPGGPSSVASVADLAGRLPGAQASS